MTRKSFSLVNLGCKVNRVEADSIGATLLAAGWVSVASEADVAIINTCTVTAEADRKTRKEINRALERNPRAHVLVTGCAAAVDPEAYAAISNRIRIVGKADVAKECLQIAGDAQLREDAALRIGEGFPTRVGVKVQDGCDNACTYCVVHVARGKATSVPLDACVAEVCAYAARGVREVVLTGIDLGAYAHDGANLAALARALREAAPDVRLRISSIEPVTLDDEFLSILAEEDGMVCRHLHLPLQSGSSRVLHEMARRYSADDYLDLVEKVRGRVPSVSISTDVIVGFPGETEDDFAQTVELARRCRFSRMHLFRYSKRAGTPAAERADQVPDEVKAARMEILAKEAQLLREQDALSRLGTTERVLVESSGKGTSESYFDVAVPSGIEPGSLVPTTFATFEEDVFTVA